MTRRWYVLETTKRGRTYKRRFNTLARAEMSYRARTGEAYVSFLRLVEVTSTTSPTGIETIRQRVVRFDWFKV